MAYHNTSSHWVRVKFLDGCWWVGFMYGLGPTPSLDESRTYDAFEQAATAIAAWVRHGTYPR